MSKKLIFLLLSAFLLTQCCQLVQARSVDNNESKSSSEETNVALKVGSSKKSSDSNESPEESGLTERVKLLAFTLGEIELLGNQSVSEGKIMFKNSLKDLAVVKVKSESLAERITKLTKFVERVDKLEANPDEPIELYNLMEELEDILTNSTTATMEAPKSDDFLVEATLKKHGLDNFNAATDKEVMDFAQRFEKKLVHYFGTLSAKEKENEARMIDWFKEFEIEKDLQKKIELLPKFMNFFEET